MLEGGSPQRSLASGRHWRRGIKLSQLHRMHRHLPWLQIQDSASGAPDCVPHHHLSSRVDGSPPLQTEHLRCRRHLAAACVPLVRLDSQVQSSARPREIIGCSRIGATPPQRSSCASRRVRTHPQGSDPASAGKANRVWEGKRRHSRARPFPQQTIRSGPTLAAPPRRAAPRLPHHLDCIVHCWPLPQSVRRSPRAAALVCTAMRVRRAARS
mmetsp:Transcript_30745/g.94186  ORF Transcript_30745/g.94186 Transcript_30745/m.94186 type:complete len:212 (+) Transcript_30745:729-1364(+)